MFYAGIGSRQTPEDVLVRMTKMAEWLSGKNFILRSGGAIGADRAFEGGAKKKEVFFADAATKESIQLASKFHPAWDRCNNYIKKLHGRNAMIILGESLNSPVAFVVCWTPNGKVVGGTGLGIRIAESYQIPIYNFYNLDRLQFLKKIESLTKSDL